MNKMCTHYQKNNSQNYSHKNTLFSNLSKDIHLQFKKQDTNHKQKVKY